MKKIIQIAILFLPLVSSGQTAKFIEQLNFIEDFAKYHIEITSDRDGDFEAYIENKKIFDRKVQEIISNKKAIIHDHFKYLLEVDRKNLEEIFDKYSGFTKSEEEFKDKLLLWKMNECNFQQENILYDLFSKLEALKKQSALAYTTENPADIFFYEDLLASMAEAIEELK